jgi:hypothetical protein
MTWQSQNILYGRRQNTDTPVSGNKITYLQTLNITKDLNQSVVLGVTPILTLNSGTPRVNVMANLKRFLCFVAFMWDIYG